MNQRTNDLYTRKTLWKWYLALAGLSIIVASFVYTSFLVNRLKAEEYKRINLYRQAMEQLARNTDSLSVNCDVTLSTDIISTNTTIPVVLVDGFNNISASSNFSTEDTNIIRQEINYLKNTGFKPLVIEVGEDKNYVYYKNSSILETLTYYPFVQFILIAAFIALGYWAFSSARKGEQNRVWAGMAKETAHQLGTPITAIVAWIELLRSQYEGDENTQEILTELDNDVARLGLVADRFSKIGSAPELESVNIFEELERCREYMQRRASRKINFTFPDITTETPIFVQINSHLFDWVIENLLRNALDAMEDGKGTIGASVQLLENEVTIEVSDTGKGIPSNKFKTIFEPGFTTKKRGWGLGLSLAKRIIEEYHGGKIFVKKSILNEGTTFAIRLPIVQIK